MRGVLRHAQRPVLREVEVHLAGRLGARRHLEFDLQPVDGVGLPRLGDLQRRREQGRLPGRRRLSETGADCPLRAACECRAVHVPGAPAHRGARVDVLCHRVLDHARGDDDLDPRVDVGL